VLEITAGEWHDGAMPRRSTLLASLVAATAVAVAGGTAAAAADEPQAAPTTPVATTPPTQPLLGAPDPAGPLANGSFVDDGDGQIEDLVATGHLVAWTVRTPADVADPGKTAKPVLFPTSTELVVADERGGTPLIVEFPGRSISGLRAFRGPGGPTDPRLAVRSCTGKATSTCTVEVLALTPDAPVALRSRTSDPSSAAALLGHVDSGQRLVLGKKGRRGKGDACVPTLSVRPLAGGHTRRLPKTPTDSFYDGCDGFVGTFIYGHYVFATVSRDARGYGTGADFFYGYDLSAGKKARWREVTRTLGYAEDGDDQEYGPGVTDHGLYFVGVAVGEDETTRFLHEVLLPRDVQRKLGKHDLQYADPIATTDVCAVAATDDAIYELTPAATDGRCTHGAGTFKQIRRIVNPAWRASFG
jgi:hypothetical protein